MCIRDRYKADEQRYYSSEYTNVSLRPKLVIEYEVIEADPCECIPDQDCYINEYCELDDIDIRSYNLYLNCGSYVSIIGDIRIDQRHKWPDCRIEMNGGRFLYY